EDEKQAGGYRAGFAQLVLQVVGQADDGDAKEGWDQTSSEVARAEEQIGQRVQLEQQRPVHHRVVDVALAVVQAPAVERVQAFVVMEGLGAEIPETQHQ